MDQAVKHPLRLIFGLMAFLLMITHTANGRTAPTPPRKPRQCHYSKHSNLSQPGRNVKQQTLTKPTKCDNFGWQSYWYRIKGQAGHTLNTRPVSPETCNTESAGWLNDTHPCVAFTTKVATVCFGNSCNDSVSINITHCGSYYVYQLPKLTCTPLKRRYCGEPKMPPGACQVRKKSSVKVRNSNATALPPKTAQHPTLASTAKNKTSHEDELLKLQRMVDKLHHSNITDNERRQRTQHISHQLSNLTDLDKLDEEQRKNGLGERNLIIVVDILQKIVELNISDRSLNILVTANNILDERNEKSWRHITDDKVIRDLLITLENYGFQYEESLKNNQNTSTEFENLPNINLHVKYVKDASSFPPEGRQFTFPNASFNLSPDALPRRANSIAIIVVLWYKTLNSFITHISYGDNVFEDVNNKIITASVRPEPSMKFLQPVRVTWNTAFWIDSAVCVYWKPEFSTKNWKTDGCERIQDKLDSNQLVCECNHLTAFATMDISRDIVSKNERKALELISTIGCSVSLFAIILTLLTHAILWRRLQQNAKSNVPSQVLLHLCAAIGMTDILAIMAGPAQNDEKFCTAVSILLYFFVLAVFGWMLCEGVVIYLQLVNVYTGLSLGGRHLKVFYVIGWVLPVVVVSFLVGLNDRKNFITKNACWCRGGGPLFWTFVATISLILLINIVIFTLALRNALSSSEVGTTNTSNTSSNTESTKATVGSTKRKAKIALKGSAVLLPLLGLTWIFGLLVFNRDAIVFKYLFAIFNSLQGLMIFVFHVLLNKRVHDAINRERKARDNRKIINVIANKNACAGTLSTSDNIRGKFCSLPVTPNLPQKNTNSKSLTLMKNNYATENKNSSLKPRKDGGTPNEVPQEDFELSQLN